MFEETDEEFSAFVFKSRSEKYLMIGSNQTLSSEFRYLDANDPTAESRVIQPREADHEYFADHFGDHFFIRTNWDAENFRLVKTPDSATSKENWTDVIPHRDDVFFQGAEAFADHLVVEERKNGLMQVRIIPWDGSGEHSLDFGEPAYDAWLTNNPEIDTTVLRYAYTSMTTPRSTFDYDMVTREKTLLKEHPVLGGFDKANYTTEQTLGHRPEMASRFPCPSSIARIYSRTTAAIRRCSMPTDPTERAWTPPSALPV